MNRFRHAAPMWKMAGFGAVYMLCIGDPFTAFALLLVWLGGFSSS